MSTPTLENLISPDLHSHFFRDKKMWALESDAIAGMNFLLGAHADIHFTPARSLFLYQLKSLDALSYFSPIQAQDGAATLTSFFYQYQVPASKEQTVLIPKRLKEFVPSAWHEQVFCYENKSTSSEDQPRDQLILVASALDEKQMTLSGLDLWISQISQSSYKKVILIALPPRSLFAEESVMRHQIELILKLKQTWPQLEVKTLMDFKSANLDRSVLVDLNEFGFYYGQSSVAHYLQQRGARYYFESSSEEVPLLRVPLSFHHEMHISRIELSFQSKIDSCLSVLNNSIVMRQEIENFKPQKVSCKSLPVAPSLAEVAWQIASETKVNF